MQRPASYHTEIFAPLKSVIQGYLSAHYIGFVYDAYLFAEKAHAEQKRASGEPYITHPVAVAAICAEWKLDTPALIAALLHDVIEDQDVSKAEVAQLFGEEVAHIVDGLSKIERIAFTSKAQQQAESFRKLLLSAAKDVRIILIKLADRLHNMRTLGVMPIEKKQRIALETQEIYAPIAEKIGVKSLFRELQEICFEALYPTRFKVLSKALQAAKLNQRHLVARILEPINIQLSEQQIKAEIFSNERQSYSVYQKMQMKKLSFSEVLDIYGFRIIAESANDCYSILGILHRNFRPVFSKFKDYIAIPKNNGYQSIHTTLIGPYGIPVEFQICTQKMYMTAEYGVIAQWLDEKLSEEQLSEVQQRTNKWLQNLLQIQEKTGDSSEFFEHIKVGLVAEEVYVFTPKGKIIALPNGATPIDFAYNIHTTLGNSTVAAKINGLLVDLNTELKSGETLEIITDEQAQPDANWLEFVKTGKAKSEIRYFLRTNEFQQSVNFGERLLQQALEHLDTKIPLYDSTEWLNACQMTDHENPKAVLADIGLGKLSATVVAKYLVGSVSASAIHTTIQVEQLVHQDNHIRIKGDEGSSVTLSRCCHPIPGDLIIGEVKLGKGLDVHTQDCAVAQKNKAKNPQGWVSASWDEVPAPSFGVRVKIVATNSPGVLAQIAASISEENINIGQIHMAESQAQIVSIHLVLEVADRKQLASLFKVLRGLNAIQQVVRFKSKG